MAITSRALSVTDVTDNLRYAPVALSGVSIAFAIDRQARVSAALSRTTSRHGSGRPSRR